MFARLEMFTDIAGRHFRQPEEGRGFDNSPARSVAREDLVQTFSLRRGAASRARLYRRTNIGGSHKHGYAISVDEPSNPACEHNTNLVIEPMAYDVRAIANWVLDCAEADGRSLTNLTINKVLFFLHANYLVRFGHPLVTAKIEAWELGPVFREIYQAFRLSKGRGITSRISRINPSTGSSEVCKVEMQDEEIEFLRKFVDTYIRMSPSALVTLSHKTGGPWDTVWNHDGRVNSSMKISDDIIRCWHNDSVRH